MGVYWIQDLQQTQLQSLIIAFILALALIALLLRSILWALAAMAPSLLSVSITLGAMGLSGTPLDVGRTMLGAVILGIAVDNGIHLLSNYRRRVMSGSSTAEATHYAVLYSGRPLIATSLALSVGFLALMNSPWQTISSFGILVGLAILVALAADLILLPALLFASRRRDRPRVDPRLEPSEPIQRPSRAAALLLVVVPVVTTLGVAGCEAIRTGPAPELACWILPNGRVAPVSSRLCPLEANSQVRLVRAPGQAAQVAPVPQDSRGCGRVDEPPRARLCSRGNFQLGDGHCSQPGPSREAREIRVGSSDSHGSSLDSRSGRLGIGEYWSPPLCTLFSCDCRRACLYTV